MEFYGKWYDGKFGLVSWNESMFYGYENFIKALVIFQTTHQYIHYYNNDRIKVKLKGLSPVQYRTQAVCRLIKCPKFGVHRFNAILFEYHSLCILFIISHLETN